MNDMMTGTARTCVCLCAALLSVSAVHAGVVDFEPDGNGRLAGGALAKDDTVVSTQFLATAGVSFGIDTNGDGFPDGASTYYLEARGRNGYNAYLNDRDGTWDEPCAECADEMGEYFICPKWGIVRPPDPLLVTYDVPTDVAFGQIWDLDGKAYLNWTEQWRIEALDVNRDVIDIIESPEADDHSLNCRPWTWRFDRDELDIAAVRITHIGTKTNGVGVGFDNFSAATDVPRSLFTAPGAPLFPSVSLDTRPDETATP